MALNGLLWPVATDGISLQIGCQQHAVKDWAEFSDEQIDAMDCEALDFWHEYKQIIMQLCELGAKQS